MEQFTTLIVLVLVPCVAAFFYRFVLLQSRPSIVKCKHVNILVIMIFLLLTLIFLLGIFHVVKKVKNGNQTQNLPPGPWGLPLLGHLISLGRNPHLTLIKWKQKYGSIVHIRFGSFPTVVLSDSKLIKEAYSMTEFLGRPQIQALHESNAGKVSLIPDEEGIIFSENSYNFQLRHFSTRKLKEFGMGRKKLEDQIHSGISEFMDFLKTKEGLPVNSEQVPSAHIIRTLWSIMMTDELDPVDAEHLNHLISRASEMGILSELAGFMPWMEKMTRTISFGHYSLISPRSKPTREFYSFTSKLMQEKKRSWAKGQSQGQGQVPADMMEMYVQKVAETTDKSSPFHASHGSAAYFLGDFFTGGIHTVHTTLVWMLYNAARNPDVQLKLQEEIDEVIGTSRQPSLLDQGQMPYADGFVHELLRMSSVVPLLLPHKTTADVGFHGYTIKKDTMIFANIYGVHHDPEIWGDPENFQPQRWFGESGRKLKSEHFFPFSTGRRVCPGEALAREQLFLYVTTLFQQFNVDFELGKVPEVYGVFELFLHASKFNAVFNKRKIQ